MDFALIIIFILAPVPFFHLWLHAMLGFWQKKPLLFYLFCIFCWIISFFTLKTASENSFFVYYPNDFSVGTGLLLVVVGFCLMAFSILTIGPKRFFVWAVLNPSSVEQKKIVSGFFKIIPHPAYLGEILASLGVFFLSGKFYLILVFLFLFFLFPIVIYFEEKELSERIKKF